MQREPIRVSSDANGRSRHDAVTTRRFRFARPRPFTFALAPAPAPDDSRAAASARLRYIFTIAPTLGFIICSNKSSYTENKLDEIEERFYDYVFKRCQRDPITKLMTWLKSVSRKNTMGRLVANSRRPNAETNEPDTNI
ncbi:hypothetical protein EVAR_22122_1 [Eumeta japonica]|uniref:Uncharacterized protein n=1 Tax=Eumeta variegata TaxID=151549 RepID=A0A4C1VYX4_EUMVA|nr:hypothetical protein EVAR_22122_1 [Eumeta japonica]